jgi:hypothetical protein
MSGSTFTALPADSDLLEAVTASLQTGSLEPVEPAALKPCRKRKGSPLLATRVGRECPFCNSRASASQHLLTCKKCQSVTHVDCYFTMESDNARYYTTHPSEWWCQNCGGPPRDRDLDVPCGPLVNRKVSFRNDKDPVCCCCQKTDNQEQMLSCDTPSCTIHAHVSCYFVTGSEQERDCLGDMADWFCHQCSGCQIPALAAAGGLADRNPAGPRGATHLVSIQGTTPDPSLGGMGRHFVESKRHAIAD